MRCSDRRFSLCYLCDLLFKNPSLRPSVRSQPVLSLEEKDHANGYGQHDENDTRITEAPVQFGHVGKVHPVQSNDKSQWNENRRNDGEYAHDVIGPHAQT